MRWWLSSMRRIEPWARTYAHKIFAIWTLGGKVNAKERFLDLVTRLLFIGENSIGKTGLLIRSLGSAKPQSNSRKLSNWSEIFEYVRGKIEFIFCSSLPIEIFLQNISRRRVDCTLDWVKITRKSQVGHLYAVHEQREEFFILTKTSRINRTEPTTKRTNRFFSLLTRTSN